MIRGLLWTLVFVGLLAGAGWWLWQRVRRLSRISSDLGRQLSEAEALLGVVGSAAAEHERQRRAEGLHPAVAPGPELAVFRDPLQVAAERRELRRTLATQRADRRAAHRPGWARHVD
jgi:hypothetical protein